jgi:exonuclease SbcC
MVISALEAVHGEGRQVAVISHVRELIERIGVQVSVERLGDGRSAVKVA